jgi:hypothetical protein
MLSSHIYLLKLVYFQENEEGYVGSLIQRWAYMRIIMCLWTVK